MTHLASLSSRFTKRSYDPLQARPSSPRFRKSTTARLSLVLVGCLLLAASSRPWSLGALAWVALVPLFTALGSERNPAAGFGISALTVFFPALAAYDGIAPLSPVLAVATAGVGCIPYGVAGAVAVRLRLRYGCGAMLACLPIVLCAAETLPAQPWLVGRWASPLLALGYSQFGLPTMQLARIGGVTAVTFWLLSVNAAVAWWFARPGVVSVVLLLTLGAAAAGSQLLAAPARGGPALHVRIVQPVLREPVYAAARHLEAVHLGLVQDLVALGASRTGGVDLTVYPEGAFPGPIRLAGQGQGDTVLDLPRLLTPLGPALFGASAQRGDGVSNAAFAWDGRLTHVYDKQHLVPIAEGRLVAGSATRVVTLAGVRISPLICFEAAFPDLALSAARNGAKLLAVLTNDAFASYLGTPLLHLRVAAFRAVETGLPLVFASNAGPSAVLDATGRIVAMTRSRERVALDATLSLGAGPTPFVRWGDWLGKTTRLLALVLVVLVGARGGHKLT